MRSIQDLGAEQFGSFAEGEMSRHSDPLALVQLLLIYYLLKAREARQTTSRDGVAGIKEE
jgi:hypothetical protein